MFWGKMHIRLLWVHPDRRQRGLGRRMMSWAEQRSRELGCYSVTVERMILLMNEFDFGEHFASLIRECEGEFRFRGGTESEVREWQMPFRQSLRRVLGLANMEHDLAGFTPDAELLDSVDLGSYVRESWRIRTEPTVPLPCYLLRPKSAPPKPPLVLTPHGHGHPHVYVGLFHSPRRRRRSVRASATSRCRRWSRATW